MRSISCRMFLCLALCLCLRASAGSLPKVNYKVKPIRSGGDCDPKAAARKGDQVVISLYATADASDGKFKSNGAATQRIVVGRHPVEPLNHGLLGMCVGDQRAVEVSFDGASNTEYVVEMLENKNRGSV